MFSYSGDPSASTLDEVRFLTGDTTAALALLQDEEITYLLGVYTTVAATVPEALRAMLAKIAQDTLTRADGITRDLAERRMALEQRLRDLERQSQVRSVAPFVGGVSRAERDARRQDTDLLQPAFERGQLANPPDSEETSAWR